MNIHLGALLLLLTSFVQSCTLHQRTHGDSSISPRELANSSTHTAQPGPELLRRWYGVKTLPSEGLEHGYISPHYYPWPITCSDPKVVQPIRYCFKDERSAKNLQKIVDMSIAAWAQAMLVSSLAITTEPSCRGVEPCLCSDSGVAKDALMISDETRDEDDEFNLGPNCVTASTVGYRYIPKGEPNSPYRHYMKFCSYAPEYSWGQEDAATRDMVHELGHVMGLQHEHQRPDRNRFIWFKCKNLKGYDDAFERARIDEDGWFDDEDDSDGGLPMRERMSRICNHEIYAEKFFPTALEYLRKDAEHMDNPDSQAIASNMEASEEFDYESIMIYDADLMSRDKNGKKYVLFRRTQSGGIGAPVWMGGGVDGDPTKTQVSAGDVARIAMLYNSGTPENTQAQDWHPVRVKIRDRIDLVVPAPRKRDESRDEL